jgi:type IV secretory pathway VirB4 component
MDIATVPRNSAARAAEMAYNTARLAMSGRQKDVQAERKYVDAELVMHALTQQSLHDVHLAILVSGETEQDLRNHASDIQTQMGMALKLTTLHGVQGELLKLWSTTRKREIHAPLTTRNMLSNGIGCLAGVLGYHRVSRTDGPLWGIDGVRRAPIFFDMFSGNAAGHMLILGKTGFGKTWFLNQLTMRGAAIMGWKVIGVDAFRNGERIETAAGAGARCNWIGTESAINIFDIVVDPGDPGWVNNQAAVVLNQLSLLLGKPGRSPEGKEQLIPRDFSVQERGFLSRAILSLYEQVTPDALLTAMPILSDLIAKLETFREDGAKLLAKDIRIFCFGTEDESETRLTAEGVMFNRHSTVDWSFGKDINYYDFSKVPDLYRPFYYAMAIGAINRYMRDPRRDVKRRTLLMIDEFGYVTQVQAVAQMAADICKVARKYGIALVVLDQNPTTFLNSAPGIAIWENTRVKMMFHLDDRPARLVGENISDLTPPHVEFLSRAGKGECVVVIDNDVFVMVVETNLRETRAFQGS